MAQESLFKENISTTATAQDSAYIIKLIDASQKYEYKNMDVAWSMVDTAMALSRSKNFGYGIGNAYIAYAIYSATQGNYALADSFLRQAYPYCYFTSRIIGSNRLLALWYQNAGILAAYQGDYKKSISYDYSALHVLNEFPADTPVIALRINTYNDIGSMLQYLHQGEKAIYYLKKGENLAKQHDLKETLAQIYVNFGSTYGVKNEWKKSAKYYERAIRLCKEYNNIFVLQVAYLGLANIYKQQKINDSAIIYLNKAILVSDKTNPYMSKVTPYLFLGQIYFAKKEYPLSIKYGTTALKLAEQLKAPQNISWAHALLADVYSATGQWEKAYQHQFTYTVFKDSMRNTQKARDINQLEIKYRVAEKDRQLAEQNLSLNKQKSALREKNFWITGISLCMFLLCAFFYSLYLSYRQKKKLQLRNLEVIRLKAIVEGEEKERARIAKELHDGVSSQLLAVKLNLTTTINRQNQKILKKEDFKESLSSLDEAMQDLRSTAHNLIPVDIREYGLVNALEHFCRKMDHSSTTKVFFQKYGETEPADPIVKLSVFRVVQELVQNALKHAQATYVLVQLNCEKDFTGITVQDDGRGFNPDHIKKGSGLDNLNARVNVLNGFMEIKSEPDGTSIYLEIKMQPE